MPAKSARRLVSLAILALATTVAAQTPPEHPIDFEIADVQFEPIGSDLADITVTGRFASLDTIGPISVPCSLWINGVPAGRDSVQFVNEVADPCTGQGHACRGDDCYSPKRCVWHYDLSNPPSRYCACTHWSDFFFPAALVGHYFVVTFKIDPDDEFPEWNEDNNEVTITSDQPALPSQPMDLAPERMNFISNGSGNYDVEVEVTYRYLQSLSAVSVPCSLYVNGMGVGSGMIGLDNVDQGDCAGQVNYPICVRSECPIGTGGCHLVINWIVGNEFDGFCTCDNIYGITFGAINIQEGDYVSVKVDPTDLYGEWNEYNNLLTSSFTLTDLPGHQEFLCRSYPNPFNPSVTITYEMPERDRLSIRIYDARGRLVRILTDQVVDAGFGRAVWNGEDSTGQAVSSGVYFFQARAAKTTIVDKLALIR